MSLRNIERLQKREIFLQKIRIPMILAFILSAIFLYNYVEIYDICKISKRLYELDFEGKVIEKTYQEWNHGYHFLEIETKSTKKVHFSTADENRYGSIYGVSYTWDKLDVGDLVRKKTRGFEIEYKKPSSLNWEKLKMSYELCDNSNN